MSASRDELDDREGASRRPAAVTTAAWGRDLLVGWRAPWGPSLARVRRGSATHDAESLVLGAPGASADPPVLVGVGERLGCAWIDAEGAWAGLLSPHLESVGLAFEGNTRGSDDLAHASRVVLSPVARAVAATHAEEGHAWLAVADGSGIRGGALRESGLAALGDEPWVRRQGGTPRMALAEVRGAPLLVVVYPGERELLVVRQDAGRAVVVTHRHERALLDLAIATAGSRVGLALVEEGRTRVAVAILDAAGRLTERPNVLVDRYAGDAVVSSVGGASVVWIDDAFHLVVHDEGSRAAHVLPFAGGGSARPIGRVLGAPATRFVAPRLELVSAETDDDEGALSIVRVRPDGSEAVPLEVRLAPPPRVAEERGSARAALCCTEVARTIAGTSYRGAEIVAEPRAGGACIALERTHQTLSIRFVGDRRFAVTLETRGEEGQPLAPPPGSLARLAAWVRQGLSSSARSAAAREATWARAMAAELAGSIPVHDARVQAASATGAVLEVELAAVPRPEVVERWTSRVREQLSAGAHRGEAPAG